MSAYSRIAFQLTVLCLALSIVSLAAEDASLYVVHGVPGRDVAANLNPGLPVDVLLNDDVCYIRGLTFGSTSGPITLPAGDYDIKVSPANSLAACTNSPEAETTVKLAAGGAATVAVALNSSGAPTLLTFADNLNAVPSGESRLTFANAADAGTLKLTLTQVLVKNPKTRTFTLNPGAETSVVLPIGSYSLEATANGGATPLVTGGVIAENQAVDLIYIVGSAGNNSVSLITRLIRDVF